jgi:ribosomal protein L31E
MNPRPMAHWVDAAGRIVGRVLQGARFDERSRRAVAFYRAEVLGHVIEDRVRFHCAATVVKDALVSRGVAAVPRML